MITSSSGVLGKGTQKQFESAKRSKCGNAREALHEKMSMNFRGHSLSNRLVHWVVPKRYYATKGNEKVFGGMMHEYADDALALQTEGFRDRNGKLWRLCFVGNLGDWPQQVKTGGLKRSFQNVPKQARSKKPCKGICQVCPAGQPGFDFENMSLAAPFFSHMYEDEPWEQDTGILKLVRLRRRRGKLWRNDIWHGFHLGSGIIFVCSGLVEALELMEGTSVKSRLATMNSKLVAFQLHTNCGTLSFDELTKDRLGWKSKNKFPKGGWQKATDTVQLMKFLIYILQDVPDGVDTILSVVKKAAIDIDFVFTSLYEENIFIFGERAHAIAVAALTFLQLNMKLAAMCHAVGKKRFLQMPKLHQVHHTFATMFL